MFWKSQDVATDLEVNKQTQKFSSEVSTGYESGKDSKVKAASIRSSRLLCYKLTDVLCASFFAPTWPPTSSHTDPSTYLRASYMYLATELSGHVTNFFFWDAACDARSGNSNVVCTVGFRLLASFLFG
jgi:hypothetical protein